MATGITTQPSPAATSRSNPADAPNARGPAPVSTTDLLWLLVAILLSLALRIPFFNIPMIHDEGGYAYATRGWLNGTGTLYDDLWISRPQGIFALYGLVFQFLGESVWALRFTAWLFVAGTVHATWFFARRWTVPRIANLAAILTAVLLSLPNLEGFTANAEIFMGLPIAFAAFWLVRQSQVRWSIRNTLLAGILIGIGTVLKPSAITMFPAALAFIWLAGPAPRRDRRQLVAALSGGTVIIGAITLVHGWTLGWSDFIYATVTYRLTLQSSATVTISHHLSSLSSLAWTIVPLLALAYLLFVFRIRLHTAPAGISPLRARPRGLGRTRFRAWRSRTPLPRDRAGLMLRLWIVAALIGIAMGGDWWSHYLIQLAPPLALWLAWNLDGITRALGNWKRPVFVLMSATLLLMPFAILVDGPEGLLAELYGHPGYPAQAEVSRYIRDHTDPDDTIFVAFDQAAIYYLSDRKPAYRHLYDQELRALPDSYADIIAIIQSDDRPVYIVSTLHPGPFPDDSRAFWREVGQYYEVETTIDGVPIYRAMDTP